LETFASVVHVNSLSTFVALGTLSAKTNLAQSVAKLAAVVCQVVEVALAAL